MRTLQRMPVVAAYHGADADHVGEEDGVTPPADGEFLAKGSPGAEFAKIPGAGHLTNLERPEAFNSALEAFLNRHAQRASVVSTA